MLLTRLDGLLVDLDPSAIMVHGGGMTAVVAAQVAFWRQIPVVHLQAGVATRRPALPLPAGGEPPRHRPARVAVPHHRRRRARQPDRAQLDPRRRHDGREPRAGGPALRRARAPRARREGRGWCWSGWTGPTPSASSPACRSCWSASPTSSSSSSAGSPRTAPRTRWPLHERAVVVRDRARRRSCSGSSRRAPCWSRTIPSWSTDAPGLGAPAVLVDGPHIAAARRLDPQHPQPGRDGHGPAGARRRPPGPGHDAVGRPGGAARGAGRGVDVRADAVAAARPDASRPAPTTSPG